jgi:hypothetical protein
MFKASLVSLLIDDHSILHIITCIRYDRNDCIRARRVLSEVILIIILSPYERLLWEEQSEHFVIHPVWMIVVWGSHSLLCHLTLIHIPRRLVIVWEGNC